MEQKLSLDEVIELSKSVVEWDTSFDDYQGFVRPSPKEPILVVVSKKPRLFRRPAYSIKVNCMLNTLARYTNPEIKEIYDKAEKYLKELIPKRKEEGLAAVKEFLKKGQ